MNVQRVPSLGAFDAFYDADFNPRELPGDDDDLPEDKFKKESSLAGSLRGEEKGHCEYNS